ncbi:hypothetical protein CK203_063505 [Vitis vinifera]|uniref:Uncharacterized protein n=1 Tax=Vitis vinifera TaxID=29760 RepID=A0A438G6V2_VITVI|nr:hypothetical protein CK203_063505 [Vitis vinifera]
MQTQHTAIISQIQKHLGILPPPKHDMPGPSEPTAPSEEATPAEKTMPHEETTTVEIKTPIQSTQETTSESSSPHDPLITTQKVLFYTFKSLYKPSKGEKQRKPKRSKEKQGGKQKTVAVVFFGTFGVLPEVHLYSIYHFKAQEVKNPTLQTVYDLELK